MPRENRKLSSSGLYHVVLRGINKQVIFECEDDYIVFLNTLRRYREKADYRIFAYCLMSNHVHILMKTGTESVSLALKRICCSYVYWYNQKYERSGHLFQSRFHSEPVESRRYLLAVLRYIHLNPVKAELVTAPENYRWSSYKDYLHNSRVFDYDSLLKLLDDERPKALFVFKELHCSQQSELQILDLRDECRNNDNLAIKIIIDMCKIDSPGKIKDLNKATRDEFLKQLLINYRLPVKQLSRITGISTKVLRDIRGDGRIGDSSRGVNSTT